MSFLKKNGKTVGLALTALLAAASFLVPAGVFARWTAMALVLVSVPPLVRMAGPRLDGLLTGRLPRWRELAASWLPLLAVTVGTLVALGPVSLGQMPVSQDHANHYFSTHILVHELIPSGRLFGWTDSLGTGYPFGDIYPTACYLVTGLAHLVSFGLVPLQVSYALGIAIAWLVPALAVTVWARRLGGPWGAAAAGLLYALDVGGDREGGWIYSMFHGVWPQHLGVGVWLFGLYAAWRFTERLTTRRLAVCVLVTGLGLWVHPMNALTLLLAALILFAVRLFVPDRPERGEDEVSRGVIRLIPAFALAGVVGLAWVSRMMLGGDVVYAYTSSWKPVTTLMARLLAGELFAGELVFVSALALTGVAFVLAQGRRFGILLLALLAGLVAVGSMDLVIGTDLGLAGGQIDLIQYRRFSIPAKPLWYALAGGGLSAIGAGLARVAERGAPNLLARPAARVLTAILLAPFAFGLLWALPGIVKSPAARPLTLERTGDLEAVAAIRELLEQEKERCAPGGCKAVYWEKRGHGGLYPVPAMADAGYAWHPTLKLPANNFKWQNPSTNFVQLARLGVTVVISKWDLDHQLLTKLGRFGRHRVYRLAGEERRLYSLSGGGQARAVNWEPERRVFQISGAGPAASLRLSMPPYKKWKAVQNGRDLRLKFRKEEGLNFSEIKGVEDGELTLEYADWPLENLFFALATLLIAACLAGVVLPPRQLPVLLSGPRLVRAYQLLPVLFGAVVLSGAIAVTVGGRAAASREWLVGEQMGTRLIDVLHRGRLVSAGHEPRPFCVPPYVRNPSWECSEHELAPELVPAPRRAGKIPSCLAVGVEGGGQTELVFDVPGGASAVKGRLHALSGGAPSARLVPVGDEPGEPIDLGAARRGGAVFRAALPEGTGRVALVLESSSRARACVEMVALGLD